MRTKLRFMTYVLAFAAGLGFTLLPSALRSPVKGFSQEEAQAKLGHRVKWKASAISIDKFINTGVVAYSTVINGERLLVIDWDEKLPGMKHRITQIDRKEYQKIIAEVQ